MNSNSGVADINKVNASDMNEIKNTINGVDSGTEIVNNLVVGSVKTKNLFDKNSFTTGDLLGGNLTAQVSSRQALWLEVGTYTFSTNKTSAYAYDIAVQNTGLPPFSSYPTFSYNSGWQTGSSFTFTINTAGWVSVLVHKGDGSALTTTDINNILGFNYQLEKGSTATTYTAFQNLNTEEPIYLSYTNPYNLTLNCIKIGKIVMVNIQGSGASFSSNWTDYTLTTISSITAKEAVCTTFTNQVGQTGDISIAKGSNQIKLNYRQTNPTTTNSWIRAELIFVIN